MKKIELTRGLCAIVDDEDYEMLSKYSWYAHRSGHTYYAGRAVRKDDKDCKKSRVFMHNVLLKTKEGQVVDHVNHDGMDNRKENLRSVTPMQNCWNRLKRKTDGMTSRYMGVTKRKDRWRAEIQSHGRNFYLGSYETEEEARDAYQRAREKRNVGL